MRKKKFDSVPEPQQLEQELKRERYKRRYRSTLRSTVYALITVAAVAVLVATLWMPVLQIYGSSMTPTLLEGDIVISFKEKEFQRGDVVAFYYGNKLLVKRYIASPGSWVDMDENGVISVDGEIVAEPYVMEPSRGQSDLEYPYQVPEEKHFLVGDHRATSVDSRHTTVGCISEEFIVGKIVFRVWPLERFGPVE